MGMEKGSGGPLRIVLDLEPGAEPITGRIGVSAGPSEQFAGVMQLVAALDRLRGDQPAHDLAASSSEPCDSSA